MRECPWLADCFVLQIAFHVITDNYNIVRRGMSVCVCVWVLCLLVLVSICRAFRTPLQFFVLFVLSPGVRMLHATEGRRLNCPFFYTNYLIKYTFNTNNRVCVCLYVWGWFFLVRVGIRKGMSCKIKLLCCVSICSCDSCKALYNVFVIYLVCVCVTRNNMW